MFLDSGVAWRNRFFLSGHIFLFLEKIEKYTSVDPKYERNGSNGEISSATKKQTTTIGPISMKIFLRKESLKIHENH